jgi:hypothetical protein
VGTQRTPRWANSSSSRLRVQSRSGNETAALAGAQSGAEEPHATSALGRRAGGGWVTYFCGSFAANTALNAGDARGRHPPPRGLPESTPRRTGCLPACTASGECQGHRGRPNECSHSCCAPAEEPAHAATAACADWCKRCRAPRRAAAPRGQRGGEPWGRIVGQVGAGWPTGSTRPGAGLTLLPSHMCRALRREDTAKPTNHLRLGKLTDGAHRPAQTGRATAASHSRVLPPRLEAPPGACHECHGCTSRSVHPRVI